MYALLKSISSRYIFHSLGWLRCRVGGSWPRLSALLVLLYFCIFYFYSVLFYFIDSCVFFFTSFCSYFLLRSPFLVWSSLYSFAPFPSLFFSFLLRLFFLFFLLPTFTSFLIVFSPFSYINLPLLLFFSFLLASL